MARDGAVCAPVWRTTNKPDTQHALTDNDAAELSQLMEGTTAGALIPEIERRGFQELLEAEVSALTGAQLHERCPDQRATHLRRLLTTQVGDQTLAIPLDRRSSACGD